MIGVDDEAATIAHKPRREKLDMNRWGTFVAILLVLSLAACAVPAVESENTSSEESVTFESHESSDITSTVSTGVLPMLSATYDKSDMGMGYEGAINFDISDFDNCNPWTKDAQLKKLPVYKNLSYTDFLIPVYLDKDELRIMAVSAAKALGMEILDFSYETVSPDFLPPKDSALTGDETRCLSAKTETANIYVEGDGHVSVRFNEPLKLPAVFNFTSENTSHEEAMLVLDYLSEQFSELMHFVQPEKITWFSNSFNGDQSRYYQMYDGAGDLTKKILSYNFNSIFFSPSDHGLWDINISNSLTSTEKIGDFPIITWEQAHDLLLDGHYITSVPKEKFLTSGSINEDLTSNVELIYRVHDRGTSFMPYCRFAVKIASVDNMAEGLINYGFFYVPAVSGEYLTDFPVWDGTINR